MKIVVPHMQVAQNALVHLVPELFWSEISTVNVGYLEN